MQFMDMHWIVFVADVSVEFISEICHQLCKFLLKFTSFLNWALWLVER